jgi:4-hydroxybenzoate polyprenyltransferase
MDGYSPAVGSGGGAAGPRSGPALVRALLAACHPLPCLAVTLFTVALAVKAGNTVATCALVAVAVGAGQLSIGWSNDRIDAARDRAAGRRDKPVAAGRVPSRVLDSAIGAAVVVTVVASLSLGWRAGLLHLAAVGCGWLYNAGLKATWWSWVPYAVAFGSLPAIATLALSPPVAPPAWAVVAAATLGVAAHITNVLPDMADDEAAGIRGLPHRLGARAALIVAGAALLMGSATAVLGPPGDPALWRWIGLGLAVLAAFGVTIGGVRGAPARWTFQATIAIAALDVILLLGGPPLA